MADSEGETKFNKQFLGALNSASVSGKLGEIIKSAIVANEKTISNAIEKRFTELMASIQLIRDEIKQRDVMISDLRDANGKLQAENNKLKVQLVELDSASRRDNLTITGLKLAYADAASTTDAQSANSSSRIVEQVVSLCNRTLDLPVTSDDISAAFPIYKGSATAPSVVLVKFLRRHQRDKIYMARKKLQSLGPGSKVFINEDLPNDLRKLLGSLRSAVKSQRLLGAWSSFGKIYAKKLDSSIHHVSKLADVGL